MDGYAYFDLNNPFSQTKSWPSFQRTEMSKRQGKDVSEIIQDGDETYEAPANVSAPEKEEENDEKSTCEIVLDSCFGSNFFDLSDASSISVQHTFKRIAFDKPICGDCLIIKLVGNSGENGLDAFLPQGKKGSEKAGTRQTIKTVGLEGTRWEDIDFGRDIAVNETSREFVRF